jgi:nitroreductase
MLSNPVIEAMMRRKSIRKYTDQMPSDEVIETVVRAGMQAPFASQSCSLLLSKGKKDTEWGAPLEFTVCVDSHKLERIMAKRDWKMISNDLMILMFGMQDAVLMAENMVIAAESLGMGSCFIGSAMYLADKIAKEYDLPRRIFPLVGLVMGYPDEDPPVRPRYPLDYVLFEDKYPEFDGDTIASAMKDMDDGYLAQGYYKEGKFMIKLTGDREETFDFDTYSWTEHISRKWGQWYPSPVRLLEQLKKRGFDICGSKNQQK